MPGQMSLAAQQYYAHPRNYFWRFIEEIFALNAALPYEQRCLQLLERRVALWDVLKTCTRSGSLDSDIISSSIIPNDFHHFLNDHPDIKMIYFNGTKAEQVFRRYVVPSLSPAQALIPLHKLPSTSPANASIPWHEKLERWRQIAR
jgi:double-stranded uracil-DNA glycosylase